MSQIKSGAETREAVELICESCGGRFIFRRQQQEERILHKRRLPRYCFSCSRAWHEKKKQERTEQENKKWERKKAEETAAFEKRLAGWKCVEAERIIPQSGKALYVIGNGFDLMHGVRSSYASFQRSLGKNSSLRYALENYLTPDDIWADFENALAHFEVSMMADDSIVDMWLDTFGAYEEDASAADFYMAVEAAADPMATITNELPRRFRKWVEGLFVGTKDRPLKHMFSEGKVLCFNYTEFVEKLYAVPEENVCYIHGCRRRKKGQQKEKLILGHRPEDSDESFESFKGGNRKGANNPYRYAMKEIAQENVIQMISACDESLTKNSSEIIKVHKDFFRSLCDTKEIITIGHSYSQVDWAYFKEITSNISDVNAVRWYFGCHGLRDLDQLEDLLAYLGIQKSSVCIFRTDTIQVTFENSVDKMTVPKTEEKV